MIPAQGCTESKANPSHLNTRQEAGMPLHYSAPLLHTFPPRNHFVQQTCLHVFGQWEETGEPGGNTERTYSTNIHIGNSLNTRANPGSLSCEMPMLSAVIWIKFFF